MPVETFRPIAKSMFREKSTNFQIFFKFKILEIVIESDKDREDMEDSESYF